MKQADVINAITQAIDRGEYSYGSRLPSTRELAGELGTTQQTVAAALTVMAGMGLVETQERGKAKVISGKPSQIRLGYYRSANREVATGTTAWKRDSGGDSIETPSEVRQVVASAEDADTGIPVGTDVVERSRIRSTDGVPVQHKRTLLTIEAATLTPPEWSGLPPMMGTADIAPPEGMSLATWLGMGVETVTYTITIAPASAAAAGALTVPTGTPCFRIVSRGLREDGSTAYSTVTTSSTRSRIEMEITD